MLLQPRHFDIVLLAGAPLNVPPNKQNPRTSPDRIRRPDAPTGTGPENSRTPSRRSSAASPAAGRRLLLLLNFFCNLPVYLIGAQGHLADCLSRSG